MTATDYVYGAIGVAERERWPLVGLSTTRICLNLLALRYNDTTTKCLACFICRQLRTSAQPRNLKKDDLATDKRRMLWMIFEVHQQPKPCAQRWSTTKSREGRLSYRQASDAVDDKYQRGEEQQKPKPRTLRWFAGLSVSCPCRTLRIKKTRFMS